ncbi:endonuclease dU [[Eubacterium] cellulosolvens]
MIKKEIRVLGVSFAATGTRRAGPTQIVGVVYRGNRWLEGVMRRTVPPEEADLTPGIAKMVTGSPHYPQLRVIVLDELITKSGNYADIEALSKKTKLPVIAVVRRRVSVKGLANAPVRLPQRAPNALSTLPCRKWKTGGKTFFIYSAGLAKLDIEELLEVCASREGIPEAARVARITASALEKFLFGRAPQADVPRLRRPQLGR